jgi:hypothetical protein
VSTGGRLLLLLQAGWGAAPGKVLYVGDHMASDLLEPAQVHRALPGRRAPPPPPPQRLLVRTVESAPPRPNAFSDR